MRGRPVQAQTDERLIGSSPSRQIEMKGPVAYLPPGEPGENGSLAELAVNPP